MMHEEIQADLSLFALDALDPAERREIEAHLASGCAACEHELAGWREVVGTMALAGQDAQPRDLKSTLLQRLQSPSRRTNVIAFPRWAATPLAAAAAILIVLGVVHEVGTRSTLDRQQRGLTSLREQLGTAQDGLQHLREQLAAKEKDAAALRAALTVAEQSLAILQAPGLQMAHLKEAPKAPPAEAHVLISTDTGRALFYAFDLPQPPEGSAYELWWITEKEGPVNAGVFQPDAKGIGRVDAQVPTAAGAIQAAAVTIEPAGGVPKPTGPMVLLGDLPSPS
jgi:anti-sigma-K factor RskA